MRLASASRCESGTIHKLVGRRDHHFDLAPLYGQGGTSLDAVRARRGSAEVVYSIPSDITVGIRWAWILMIADNAPTPWRMSDLAPGPSPSMKRRAVGPVHPSAEGGGTPERRRGRCGPANRSTPSAHPQLPEREGTKKERKVLSLAIALGPSRSRPRRTCVSRNGTG